jgi:hypothetical protein
MLSLHRTHLLFNFLNLLGRFKHGIMLITEVDAKKLHFFQITLAIVH